MAPGTWPPPYSAGVRTSITCTLSLSIFASSISEASRLPSPIAAAYSCLPADRRATSPQSLTQKRLGMTADSLDPERLRAKQSLLAQGSFGAYTAPMIALGVRLGLYGALADAGSVTSRELAERTGLHERWLREWLRGQAAAGLIEYEGKGRFRLSLEAAYLLADEESPAFAGGRMLSIPVHVATLERLPGAF